MMKGAKSIGKKKKSLVEQWLITEMNFQKSLYFTARRSA